MPYKAAHLIVKKISGGYALYAPNATTTDDLTFYPNTTDGYSWLKLFGNSAVELAFQSTTYFQIRCVTDPVLKVSFSTPDAIIENPTANQNLFLRTQGTGKIKAFTKTAHADQVIDGYVTMLDAAGNALYLAALTPV